MFTGLVVFKASVVQALLRNQVIEIHIQKPSSLEDVQEGDSIAVDGVCLTLEKQTSETLIFALAYDTIKTTKWTVETLKNKVFNLELSLKNDQRWGGHFVTGHVDGIAQVRGVEYQGENKLINLSFPKNFSKFLFKKAFVTINGVSLTLQEFLYEGQGRVGLVPETLKRTNLSELQEGSWVTFEICYLTRIVCQYASRVYKKE